MMSPAGFVGLRLDQARSLINWVDIMVSMASIDGSPCALFCGGWIAPLKLASTRGTL